MSKIISEGTRASIIKMLREEPTLHYKEVAVRHSVSVSFVVTTAHSIRMRRYGSPTRERQRKIARFAAEHPELTQYEIASRLGINQSRVSEAMREFGIHRAETGQVRKPLSQAHKAVLSTRMTQFWADARAYRAAQETK